MFTCSKGVACQLRQDFTKCDKSSFEIVFAHLVHQLMCLQDLERHPTRRSGCPRRDRYDDRFGRAVGWLLGKPGRHQFGAVPNVRCFAAVHLVEVSFFFWFAFPLPIVVAHCFVHTARVLMIPHQNPCVGCFQLSIGAVTRSYHHFGILAASVATTFC